MIASYYVIIAICLLMSGFFSASEMAFSSCNRIRLEHLKEEGNRRASLASKIADHYDDTLSTILVGNNLVNIASSSIASMAVILFYGEQYTWIATLIISIGVIIVGETIPKIVAKKNATRVALAVATPISFLSAFFKPITSLVLLLVNLITKPLKGEQNEEEDAAVEELHTIFDTAEDESVIEEDTSELVSAAIDFSEISVSEIMTARVDMVAIDIEDTWEDTIRIIGSSRFSRIPVFEESRDKIIGVISLKHVLKAMTENKIVDLRSFMMPPCFVYKTMKLPAVLSVLRDAQQHLAIVTDEYGGTLGVVSMEDILEQLVGDIWDETDTVRETVIRRDDDSFEMDGDAPVSEMLELMNWSEDEFDYASETVGGWCIEYLDYFPQVNEKFDFKDIEITILEVDERRVRKVRLQPKKNIS